MSLVLAALLIVAAPAEATASPPPVQRPTKLSGAATEPSAPAPSDGSPTVEPAPAETTAPGDAEAGIDPATGEALPTEATPTEATPTEPVAVEPVAVEPTPAAPAPAAKPSEMLTVSAGADGDGPPFYTEADAAAFRAKRGIPEPEPPRQQARWRCLIADPTCGFNFEINATSAYNHRFQQGDVRSPNARNWASGRAQYDFWANVPVLVEQEGRAQYTRMTLGPKGGVAFSDGGDLWGNLGLAARYWFGRGRWAPTFEFTSALSFKLGSRETRDLGGAKPKFEMTRGPVGFTADVGVGLGGFGAIVIGGQYDSPLAREDIPEQFRVSAGGAFFIGFRGNILWGGPAAAAIVTHTMTQRFAEEAR